jgi:pimeloyl-ACP methyl ester carboxylesterase
MTARRRHAGSSRRAAARDAARTAGLDTTVRVERVAQGDLYVRVNTIGRTGDRPFVLVPGIGVSSDYFERLAPNLNRFGPVHALDLPGCGTPAARSRSASTPTSWAPPSTGCTSTTP